MFERELKSRLESIFGIKASFDLPGESLEQEVIFINIETSYSKVSDKIIRTRAQGKCFLYVQRDKAPVSFFAKRIAQSDKELTQRFFFYEVDAEKKVYQNIVERSFGFIYFFEGEYDPNLGELTEVVTEIEVIE